MAEATAARAALTADRRFPSHSKGLKDPRQRRTGDEARSSRSPRWAASARLVRGLDPRIVRKAIDKKAAGCKDTGISRGGTIDAGHDRIETGTTTVIRDVAWLRQRPASRVARQVPSPDSPGGPARGVAIRYDIATIRPRVRRPRSGRNLRRTQPRAPEPDRPTVPSPRRGHAPERDKVRLRNPPRPRHGVVGRRRRGRQGPAGHQDHRPPPPPRGGQQRAIHPEHPAERAQDRPQPGIGRQHLRHRRIAQQRLQLRPPGGGLRHQPQQPAPGPRQPRAFRRRVRQRVVIAVGGNESRRRPASGPASAAEPACRQRRGTGRRDRAAARAARRPARGPGPRDRPLRRCGRPARRRGR